MEQARLIPSIGLEARDTLITKDPSLVNSYIEIADDGIYCIKRPGLRFLGSVCNGTGQGTFYLGRKLVFVGCDTLFVLAEMIVMETSVKAGGV